MGLGLARGDFAGFVDSDDFISDVMYEKLLISLLNADADVAECGYYTCNENFEIINKYELIDELIEGSYACSYNYAGRNTCFK